MLLCERVGELVSGWTTRNRRGTEVLDTHVIIQAPTFSSWIPQADRAYAYVFYRSLAPQVIGRHLTTYHNHIRLSILRYFSLHLLELVYARKSSYFVVFTYSSNILDKTHLAPAPLFEIDLPTHTSLNRPTLTITTPGTRNERVKIGEPRFEQN